MPLAEIRKETERRMVVSIDALKAELKHLRTGRASVGLLEGVHVEYYGTATPLNQVANLSTPDATLILIQPWDAPSDCPVIEVALRNSRRSGLNPGGGRPGRPCAGPLPDRGAPQGNRQEGPHACRAVEGGDPSPPPRGQRQGQEGRQGGDDLGRRGEASPRDEIQKLTDRYVAEVDAVVKAKETDILAR